MARIITLILSLCFLTARVKGLPAGTTASWTGWSNMKYLFALWVSSYEANFGSHFSSGDSYTTIGFSLGSIQPSSRNPLGNPGYPGATSSDGPNYIDYLTETYNHSLIETYDFGYGGATIDPSIVPNPYGSLVQSFQQQVQQEFLPNYASGGIVPWLSVNSLFTIFFGINDVNFSYQQQQTTTLNDRILQSYTKYVGQVRCHQQNYTIQTIKVNCRQLYAAGARNFLIMNVPPIDRSPGTASSGASNVKAQAADIGDFNQRLQWTANSLAANYADATFFQFDTNWLFTVALNHPDSSPQTAGIRNTTQACNAYQKWAFFLVICSWSGYWRVVVERRAWRISMPVAVSPSMNIFGWVRSIRLGASTIWWLWGSCRWSADLCSRACFCGHGAWDIWGDGWTTKSPPQQNFFWVDIERLFINGRRDGRSRTREVEVIFIIES